MAMWDADGGIDIVGGPVKGGSNKLPVPWLSTGLSSCGGTGFECSCSPNSLVCHVCATVGDSRLLWTCRRLDGYVEPSPLVLRCDSGLLVAMVSGYLTPLVFGVDSVSPNLWVCWVSDGDFDAKCSPTTISDSPICRRHKNAADTRSETRTPVTSPPVNPRNNPGCT